MVIFNVLIPYFVLCQYYNGDSLKINRKIVFKTGFSLKGKVIHHQHKDYIGTLKMCIFLNSVHVFMLT